MIFENIDTIFPDICKISVSLAKLNVNTNVHVRQAETTLKGKELFRNSGFIYSGDLEKEFPLVKK